MPPPPPLPPRDDHRQLVATLEHARVGLARAIVELKRGVHSGPPQVTLRSDVPLGQRVTRRLDEVKGAAVVRVKETDAVGISKEDIVLDTSGDSSEEMRRCLNEALAPYKFKVKAIHGEWFVSDGRFRLFRFFDGLVISGAAKREA